jgi:hypothetical protein
VKLTVIALLLLTPAATSTMPVELGDDRGVAGVGGELARQGAVAVRDGGVRAGLEQQPHDGDVVLSPLPSTIASCRAVQPRSLTWSIGTPAAISMRTVSTWACSLAGISAVPPKRLVLRTSGAVVEGHRQDLVESLRAGVEECRVLQVVLGVGIGSRVEQGAGDLDPVGLRRGDQGRAPVLVPALQVGAVGDGVPDTGHVAARDRGQQPGRGVGALLGPATRAGTEHERTEQHDRRRDPLHRVMVYQNS